MYPIEFSIPLRYISNVLRTPKLLQCVFSTKSIEIVVIILLDKSATQSIGRPWKSFSITDNRLFEAFSDLSDGKKV